MAETIVTLTGDDAKLLQAFNRAIAKEAEMANGFKGVEGASKKATDSAVADANRQEREWKKSADAMYREHRKLLDAKVSESRRAGQAEEAIARQTAFAEVNAALRAADQEIKAAEKILKAKQKLAAEETKLTDGPLASLKNTVTVAGAIATAVGTATKAWSLYKEAQDKALGSLEGLAPANQKLGQIAETPEEWNKLIARADASAIATGVPRDQAREVLFTAKSENFDSSYEAIMGSSAVVPPKEAAKLAGGLTSMFKNRIGPMEGVSLGLKASVDSKLDFPEMAGTIAIAAEGGSVLGSSPEETAAVAAVMAARFKSVDRAADRMKGWGVKAGIDPRFAGSGFIGSYEKVAALPEAERKEFLGDNQEMNILYTAMTEDVDKVKVQLAKLVEERKEFAKGRGELRTKIKNSEGVQAVETTKRVNIARIENEIATERNLSTTAANNEIAAKNAMTQVEQKQGSIANRFATDSASKALSFAGDRISPDAKTTLATSFGDELEGMAYDPTTFTKGPNALIAPAIRTAFKFLSPSPKSDDGKKLIEDSFKADAGKGPANTVATNTGLIKSLEDERAKLKPKLTELLDKQQITEAEAVQIKAAEFQVTKTRDVASRLGNRKDIKAEGIRLDVDKAQSRLNTVREDATLSKKEAEELSTLQGKDTQYAERIEALRREDAKNLQRATEKTNEILLDIKNSLQPSPPGPNAIQAQFEQGNGANRIIRLNQ